MSDYFEMIEVVEEAKNRRELFAAFAMLGHFVLNQEVYNISAKNIAQSSVAMADALIAELDKPNEPIEKKDSCL